MDSIAFHFRQDFDDMALRTRLLSGMALKLMELANNFSLAVSQHTPMIDANNIASVALDVICTLYSMLT